jgi:nucleotide-binding universal stress UspA family protein
MEMRFMYKRIVVPLDGSPLAEQALTHATALAERFEAEIILLKVLEPLPEATLTSPASVQRAEQLSAQLARDYLEKVADQIREEGIAVKVALLQGKPYAEIVRFSAKPEVDMIVMSTRGHSGWSRWLLGSVADRVVRGATIPVLLVQCQEACEE